MTVKAQHAVFTVAAWKADETTILGYEEWLARMIELEKEAERKSLESAEQDPIKGRPVSPETRARVIMCLQERLSVARTAAIINCSEFAIQRVVREVGRPLTVEEIVAIKEGLALLIESQPDDSRDELLKGLHDRIGTVEMVIK